MIHESEIGLHDEIALESYEISKYGNDFRKG